VRAMHEIAHVVNELVSCCSAFHFLYFFEHVLERISDELAVGLALPGPPVEGVAEGCFDHCGLFRGEGGLRRGDNVRLVREMLYRDLSPRTLEKRAGKTVEV